MSLDGPINEPRHGRPDDGRQPRPRHAAARVHRNFATRSWTTAPRRATPTTTRLGPAKRAHDSDRLSSAVHLNPKPWRSYVSSDPVYGDVPGRIHHRSR